MKEELLALLEKREIKLPEDTDNFTIMDLIFKELEKDNPTHQEQAPMGLL